MSEYIGVTEQEQRLIEQLVARSVKQQLEEFFEYGDDPAEKRRVKDGIRLAANMAEGARETTKGILSKVAQVIAAAVAGALATWFSTHGGKP